MPQSSPIGVANQTGGSTGDALSFATYSRDGSTGLDYADQRYYANQWGRFMSPDPYRASGGVGSPASWNRYSYSEGDPVNRFDPRGLAAAKLDAELVADCEDVDCGDDYTNDVGGGGTGGGPGGMFTANDFIRDSNGSVMLDSEGNPIVGDLSKTNSVSVISVSPSGVTTPVNTPILLGDTLAPITIPVFTTGPVLLGPRPSSSAVQAQSSPSYAECFAAPENAVAFRRPIGLSDSSDGGGGTGPIPTWRGPVGNPTGDARLNFLGMALDYLGNLAGCLALRK